MATFLFDQTVFGPVKSRRLGVSLGINLLPNDSKLCSFDCLYCECGWNPDSKKVKARLPEQSEVTRQLEGRLISMAQKGELPDVITFAGNGEPTMHPQFASIIDETIALRNQLAPKARIAVLSNSTMLFKPAVVEALKKIDDNILKLDSAIPKTVALMNCPVGHFSLEKTIGALAAFDGQLIIQTLFLRGEFKGQTFDNTTDAELAAWIESLKFIGPQKVMIYTIARDTPLETLEKVDEKTLHGIARKVEQETGIPVEVSC